MSHCEAVGIGMLLAARIAHSMGICKDSTVIAHQNLLKKLEVISHIPSSIPVAEIKRHLKHDKKLHRNNIPFVLLKKVGVIARNNGGYYHIVPEEIIDSVIVSYYE